MKLSYTPVNKKIRRNVYVITYDLEHGDADSRNSETTTVNDSASIEDLIASARRASEMIENNRQGGSTSMKEICDFVENLPFYFPLEYDVVYHGADIYANCRISKIKYFDEEGAEFIVTVIEE